MSKKKKKAEKKTWLQEHSCEAMQGRCEKIRYTKQYEFLFDAKYDWYLGSVENRYYSNQYVIDYCPFCGEKLPDVEVPVYTGETYFQDDVEVNKNGNNVKLKCHLLPDEEMRRIGFTDRRQDVWSYFTIVHKSFDISFSVTINKTDASDFRIDVLDEACLQPYDYQEMLRRNPVSGHSLYIMREVEKHMKLLSDAGIISGHEQGQYI